MTLVLADVSEFQGHIDWTAYGQGNPAVAVRLHNGFRPDYCAIANIGGARTHCAVRLWYQYLPASVDPAQAARAFAAVLGPPLAGEVFVLDLEEGDGDQQGRADLWHATLRALFASTLEWTYSGAYFARAHLERGVEWVAAYGGPEPTATHELWQYTDARSFAGIAAPCDASTFAGDLAALAALTHSPQAPQGPQGPQTAPAGTVPATTARQEFGPMKVLDVEKLPTAPASPFEGVLVTESFLTALATTQEKDACIRIDEAQTGDVVLLAEVNLVRGVFARGRAGQ